MPDTMDEDTVHVTVAPVSSCADTLPYPMGGAQPNAGAGPTAIRTLVPV
jgi:hypothetical protein